MSAQNSDYRSSTFVASAPSVVEQFRLLHRSGCFIIPNPWDIGSAKYLERLGFKALATTSAGFAFSRGLPDSTGALTLDAVLTHIREILAATSLPVNADFQSGYAATPENVAKNVMLCVRTGAAGLSIEDSRGDNSGKLYERPVALERLRAARHAIDETKIPVVLTARCEAMLAGEPDAPRIILDRLTAFADAGADCLFAPGVQEPEMISAIVKAVAPKPVNVLISSHLPGLSLAKLTDLGVRRVSVGSALSRSAWSGFIRAAESIANTGTFEAFDNAVPFSKLNSIFKEQVG